MRIKPRYLIPQEGSYAVPWQGRHVTEAELEIKRKQRARGQPVIWIEGIQVHALCFPDGRAWDVINGWRNGNHWLEQLEKALQHGAFVPDDYCLDCMSPALSCTCPSKAPPSNTHQIPGKAITGKAVAGVAAPQYCHICQRAWTFCICPKPSTAPPRSPRY